MKSRWGRFARSSSEASRTRSYRGRVISGRGIAVSVLGELQPEIRQEIGVTIFAGSLNVILSRPVRLRDSTALSIDGGQRRFWPASVSGTPVWIYRWVGATDHVIELIAEHHLRSALHLNDGDAIRISLSAKDIEPISMVRLLAWAVLWMGRRSWYYTRDDYLHRVGVVVRRAVAIRNGLHHAVERASGYGGRFGDSTVQTSEPPEADPNQLGDVADGSANPPD